MVPSAASGVNPITWLSPGVVDTPWWDFLSTEQKAAAFADFAQRTPVGRIGTADDIAAAIAFLVRDSFVSGHVLVCDGGARLGVA